MEQYVEPEYGENSLVEVPGTICSLLDVETELSELSSSKFESVDTEVENVIFILIDAFGNKQWESFGKGTFQEIESKGKVTSITSTFPSMTPATLTTLSTGLQPIEHGLLGWEMYFNEIDEKLLTLPFTTSDWEDPKEALDKEVNPEILFEGNSIYKKLEENGVNVFSVLNKDISDSRYTELSHKGSEVIPALNVADSMLKTRRKLENEGKTYVYNYVSEVDTIDHRKGPMTEDETNQLKMISDSIRRNLVNELEEEIAEKTLLLISADHGQIIEEGKTDLMKFEKVQRCLKKDSEGDTITPCGGGRSIFLHIQEEKVSELQKFLKEEINARVLKTEEAVEKNLFGDKPSGQKFYDRAGELVIIPNGREVYWHNTEEIEQIGYHGGLNPQEMNIPFAAVKLADLKK
ncbi:MAG: alkaline phosphatase family protein [Candidatus Nanohaloarchaea archaeon]